MEPVTKSLFCSFQQWAAAGTGIFGKYGRAGKAEQVVVPERANNGSMQISKLRTVAFVENQDKPLFETGCFWFRVTKMPSF